MKAPFQVLLAAMCITGGAAQAHEFWIEAEDYTVGPGAEISATFRNGEEMVGSTLSYVPGRSARLDMAVGDEVVPVPVRIGDDPAVLVDGLPDGLVVIIHETTPADLTYRDRDGRTGWARFTGFVEHKDLTGVLAAHDARGLPREDVRERYTRFAKALVAVGDGAGSDRAFGLRTEFVALANPYTDDVAGGLPVRLLLDGTPRADAQIEFFARDPDGTVTIATLRTDADGVGLLPVRPGHEYLVDAVAMAPVETDGTGPAWHSLWAALTFAVPEG